MTKKNDLNKQVDLYPKTRFMGSKSKLLKNIWDVASDFEFDTVLDLFSGSGIVSYMFKSQGKKVISNDYMVMSSVFAKAMVENNEVTLSVKDVERLLSRKSKSTDNFVEKTFKDLYFSDKENRAIDLLRGNISKLKCEYKQAIAMAALIRACTKKRPRGIFTYVGNRYNDGRRDLSLTLEEQFVEAVNLINNSVFDNGFKNKAYNRDAMKVNLKNIDLVYMDPPYFSPYSDNEYVRRYHFVEGLSRNWDGVEIQQHTVTKKFKSYPSPFSTRKGAADAFDKLFERYKDKILLVSYSSNSFPSMDEMKELMSKYKKSVKIIPIDHKYSFGNQGHKINNNNNTVKEYLFLGE